MGNLIAYYLNLLIMQFKDKPKAVDTIELLTEEALIDLLPTQVNNAFNIDTAVGAQLDIIGKYTGASRSGRAGGVVITLVGDDYRLLIKLSIFKNKYFSSLYDIQKLLFDFFPNQLFIFDFANMRMNYYLLDSVGSEDFAKVAVANDLLPKPMGVQLGSLIYSPDILIFFGLISYALPTQYNNSPLNTYTVYEMDRPCLSYTDAVTI